MFGANIWILGARVVSKYGPELWVSGLGLHSVLRFSVGAGF